MCVRARIYNTHTHMYILVCRRHQSITYTIMIIQHTNIHTYRSSKKTVAQVRSKMSSAKQPFSVSQQQLTDCLTNYIGAGQACGLKTSKTVWCSFWWRQTRTCFLCWLVLLLSLVYQVKELYNTTVGDPYEKWLFWRMVHFLVSCVLLETLWCRCG
jgi:hypothetical protein